MKFSATDSSRCILLPVSRSPIKTLNKKIPVLLQFICVQHINNSLKKFAKKSTLKQYSKSVEELKGFYSTFSDLCLNVKSEEN